MWKLPKYGVFPGPYFPVFSPNTDKYGLHAFFWKEYFSENYVRAASAPHFNKKSYQKQKIKNAYQLLFFLVGRFEFRGRYLGHSRGHVSEDSNITSAEVIRCNIFWKTFMLKTICIAAKLAGEIKYWYIKKIFRNKKPKHESKNKAWSWYVITLKKKQDLRSFNFYKVGFSHYRNQNWIINLQTFIPLVHLSLCSKGSQ